MTSDTGAAGPKLLEPDISGVEGTRSQTPRGRMPSFWPLIVVLVGALTIVGSWALPRTRTGEDSVAPRILSDHDSGIAAQLRESQARQEPPAQHDSHVAAQLRERQGPRQVRSPQHDSGIAAQLRERQATVALRSPGGCAPEAAAGGWEARAGLLRC
jgi:hypothetical protein